jgi:hypothetical protein
VIGNVFTERGYRDYMRARGICLWRHVEPNDVYVVASEMSARDRLGGAVALMSVRIQQLLSGLATRARALASSIARLAASRSAALPS